jgi:hypothetical protein
MSIRTRIMKFLLLICCSGILLSIQCPPLVVSSFKSGISQWVSGSLTNSTLFTQLGDMLIGQFTGGSTTGGTTGT